MDRQSVQLSVFKKKKICLFKWTHIVQTWFVQGSNVFELWLWAHCLNLISGSPSGPNWGFQKLSSEKLFSAGHWAITNQGPLQPLLGLVSTRILSYSSPPLYWELHFSIGKAAKSHCKRSSCQAWEQLLQLPLQPAYCSLPSDHDNLHASHTQNALMDISQKSHPNYTIRLKVRDPLICIRSRCMWGFSPLVWLLSMQRPLN